MLSAIKESDQEECGRSWHPSSRFGNESGSEGAGHSHLWQEGNWWNVPSVPSAPSAPVPKCSCPQMLLSPNAPVPKCSCPQMLPKSGPSQDRRNRSFSPPLKWGPSQSRLASCVARTFSSDLGMGVRRERGRYGVLAPCGALVTIRDLAARLKSGPSQDRRNRSFSPTSEVFPSQGQRKSEFSFRALKSGPSQSRLVSLRSAHTLVRVTVGARNLSHVLCWRTLFNA
jgi:hypothetical protein